MMMKTLTPNLGLSHVEVLVAVVDDAVLWAAGSDETQTLQYRQDSCWALDSHRSSGDKDILTTLEPPWKIHCFMIFMIMIFIYTCTVYCI